MSDDGLAQHLIAADFPRHDGVIQVGGLDLAALARAHGTPLFVYDADLMRRAYRALSQAVAGFAEVEIFSELDWWQRPGAEVLDTCIARHRSAV